jgi:hypothetical protein
MHGNVYNNRSLYTTFTVFGLYSTVVACRPVTGNGGPSAKTWMEGGRWQSRAIMSQPRASLWATEEIDEDLQVDVHLAIGNYGQNGLYDDGPYIRSVIVSLPHHPLSLQLNQESMKLPLLPCSIRWRSKQRLHRSLMRSSECVLHHRVNRIAHNFFFFLSPSLSFTSIKLFWKTTLQR